MPIVYQKLFHLLGEKGWTTYRIRKERLMGQGTLTALKNGTGGLDSKTISRLCETLNCQPGDLMEYVHDTQKSDSSLVAPALSSAANISELPTPELQEAASLEKKPEKQEKQYKHFTEAETDSINLPELLINIKYQLDIADTYGTDILSSLLAKARQQAAETSILDE